MSWIGDGMPPKANTGPDFMGVLKIVVFVLPPTVLPRIFPAHDRAVFGLSLVLGAILQALIPPRKNGLLIIAVVSAIALVYSLI
jgi:hypothetical protein